MQVRAEIGADGGNQERSGVGQEPADGASAGLVNGAVMVGGILTVARARRPQFDVRPDRVGAVVTGVGYVMIMQEWGK